MSMRRILVNAGSTRFSGAYQPFVGTTLIPPWNTPPPLGLACIPMHIETMMLVTDSPT